MAANNPMECFSNHIMFQIVEIVDKSEKIARGRNCQTFMGPSDRSCRKCYPDSCVEFT